MSGNLESGESSLPPMQMKMVHDENPELRWSFIRKVYSIVTFQMLLTTAVVSIVLLVHPVSNFFNSKQGTDLYKILLFVPFIALHLYQKHPINYFFLLFLNVSWALPIGLTFVLVVGKISLEIVILITTMVFMLTLYTFWAAKENHDLSHLRSFLYGSISILFLLSLIQILFPMGIPLKKLLSHIFGCLVSIIFCGCIVHPMDPLIKMFTYDQHIMAFVAIYLCVIIIFFIPLSILRFI